MRFNGQWFEDTYGDVRPIMTAELLSASDQWVEDEFLIDTGADRTLINDRTFRQLGMVADPPDHPLGGVGSSIESGIVGATLRLRRDDGLHVTFRAPLAVCLSPDLLEMSILGRDILDLFALIVDRPGNVVCMLGQKHRYQIMQG
ncbi:MAG: hypothetical protein WD768_08015 [Phycisphaeraceae bacterium]